MYLSVILESKARLCQFLEHYSALPDSKALILSHSHCHMKRISQNQNITRPTITNFTIGGQVFQSQSR